MCDIGYSECVTLDFLSFHNYIFCLPVSDIGYFASNV